MKKKEALEEKKVWNNFNKKHKIVKKINYALIGYIVIEVSLGKK